MYCNFIHSVALKSESYKYWDGSIIKEKVVAPPSPGL